MNNDRTDVSDNGYHIGDNLTEQQLKRCEYSFFLTLDNISNDFLLQICQYLNIFDVVNLASTCRRLHNFASGHIFPKLAKHLELYMTGNHGRIGEEWYNPNRVQSDDSDFILNLKIIDLENSFEKFGSFVKHLTLKGSFLRRFADIFQTECLRDFERLLDMCPNLQTLCMELVEFNKEDGHLLQHITSGIKRLEFKRCSGIPNDWTEGLKRFSKLEQITFTGYNKTNVDLFKYSHLSSLTIGNESCTMYDLEKIFDKNHQSMQQLKLLSWVSQTKEIDYQDIATLIIDKLPNLKYLAIEDEVSVKLSNSLTELPHLKSLKLFCNGHSVNSLLRNLSDRGKIEDLDIEDGVFVEEDETNKPPLVFNKLKSFRWIMIRYNSIQIFRALTKSQMPAIRNFDLDLIKDNITDLLSVFETKETLKTLTITCYDIDVRFAFLQRLIEILNLDGTRPFLNLNMKSLAAEEVSQIFN